MNKSAGFTLVELLVVVGIIGILAGLSIANFQEYRAKANDTQAINQIRLLSAAIETYIADQSGQDVVPSFTIRVSAGGTLSHSIAGYPSLASLKSLGYVHQDRVAVSASKNSSGYSIGAMHCEGTDLSVDDYPDPLIKLFGFNNHDAGASALTTTAANKTFYNCS